MQAGEDPADEEGETRAWSAAGARLALEHRGWGYVTTVDPKQIARAVVAEPYLPAYGGLGPDGPARYRETPRSLPGLVAEAAVFEEVTWRQGSRGTMTSRFAVIEVRSSGKEASRTPTRTPGLPVRESLA